MKYKKGDYLFYKIGDFLGGMTFGFMQKQNKQILCVKMTEYKNRP